MAEETPKKASGRATITADDNVKFLVTCVKFSDGGKIDWKAVAAECDIVTHGAASKRYDRLLKAHGVSKNKPGAKTGTENEGDADGGDSGSKAAGTPKSKTTGATSKRTPASKKRKVEQTDKDDAESNAKAELKAEEV